MTEIRLRPPVTLRDLEKALREHATESDNVVSSCAHRDGRDYLNRYLGWVNWTWRALDSRLDRTQLEQLLHTRHYWTLRQMDGSEPRLTSLIKIELNARRDALVELADEARALCRRWNFASGVIVVPDTNVLLHATEYFDDLDWPTALGIPATIHLVLTMVVIDEIDKLKRSRQPVRTRARQTANKIESLLGDIPSDRVVLRGDGRKETTVEVLTDPLDHQRLTDSDSEIVDRAAYLRDLTTVPVYVATWDNLMRFRASVTGLDVVKPRPEYELQDEPADSHRNRG